MTEKIGYIYIGFDRLKNESKVGMTLRDPQIRISETTNPDYQLFHYYKIELSDSKALKELEKKIHQKLVHSGIVRRKFLNNKYSEWFKCKPEVADKISAEVIGWAKSKQKKMLEDEEARIKHNETEQARIAEYMEKLNEFDCKYGPKLNALEKKATEHQQLLDKKVEIWKKKEFSIELNLTNWLRYLLESVEAPILINILFLPLTIYVIAFDGYLSFFQVCMVIFLVTYLWKILLFPAVTPIKKRINIQAVDRLISGWSNMTAYNEIQNICDLSKQYRQSLVARREISPQNPPFKLEDINKLLETELILLPNKSKSTPDFPIENFEFGKEQQVYKIPEKNKKSNIQPSAFHEELKSIIIRFAITAFIIVFFKLLSMTSI